MNSPALFGNLRRVAATGLAVAALAGTLTIVGAQGAEAAPPGGGHPPLPCERDSSGAGCSTGGGHGGGDPWVANMFDEIGSSGPDMMYGWMGSGAVNATVANELARNLGYRLCIPAPTPGRITKAVRCQD
jgi:hypothetical protein